MNSQRPLKQATLWLLFLGPFFFISYGGANWLASQQTQVTHIVFSWEQAIPFVPWTIIPYWSIDLLYALSVFICATRQELNIHARRLLSAQIIAVTCFILLPMEYTFPRPETTGLIGALFTALSNFDQPFNQAPSLHIALLVILWVLYPRHLPRILVWPFHILCILIAISVLTTYQHHFIDIPTGALLGWFCIWLWPDNGKAMINVRIITPVNNQKKRVRIALYYLIGALFITFLTFFLKGWALWLLWPAVSLLLVSLIYARVGGDGFQKSSDGRMSVASQWLLFPYLLGARINSILWTRNQKSSVVITEDVWLGRFPASTDNHKHFAVIDLTAEMRASSITIDKSRKWLSLSHLDLLAFSKEELIKTAELIEQFKADGPVLVACALGYSRSSMAVIAWLLHSGRENNVDEAINRIKKKRPGIVITENDRNLLSELI